MSTPLRLASVIVVLVLVLATQAPADDYPQWLGPRRDNVDREKDLLTAFPPGGPRVLWRAAVGGGYSGVAVAGNKVVVTDRLLKDGVANPKDPFNRDAIPGQERVQCIDDANGKVLWHVEYDCPYTISYAVGPRATPAIDADRVYTLGAQGDVHCIDLNSGNVLWRRKLDGPAPIWGFAGSPVIEGDLLIVLSSGKPLVTALNKTTGDVAWTALETKDPGYSPPTPHTFPGGSHQIVQYYPEGVAGIDPRTGKVRWQIPYGPETNGVTIVTPLFVSDDTFVLTSQYNGSAAIKVVDDKPQLLWHATSKGRKPTALHALHAQMVLHQGLVYGINNTGHIVCMDPKDGHVLWSDPKPLLGDLERAQWTAAFLTPWQPDEAQPAKAFFLATEKGDFIVCSLDSKGYTEQARAHLLDPSNHDAGRPVVWCHPAYAHQGMYWRNDKELIRVSLAK
ncbi:MAG TPA: PQQ-binding-like beta-propeller repeat protein [Tepidisphaeraceae bacterium]|jgi:outer membrane protein assembly factor BamB